MRCGFTCQGKMLSSLMRNLDTINQPGLPEECRRSGYLLSHIVFILDTAGKQKEAESA